MKSRVIIMDEQGDPSVMREDTVELAPPGAGEVLLRQPAMATTLRPALPVFLIPRNR